MVVIRAYPRLHATLLDLAGATFRKYGGAGFTISKPFTEIGAEQDVTTSIVGLEKIDQRAQSDVLALLKKLENFFPETRVHITIRAATPQHVGLGSKTTLLLSILKAVELCSGLHINQQFLQQLSNRGGTSGVGINAFFHGGFLVDSGHAFDPSIEYNPSSASRPLSIPPISVRVPIPAHWSFYLILPSEERYSGEREVAFFKANTPLPRAEVLEVIALIYHGLVPAMLDSDLPTVKKSPQKIQRVGFKYRQLHHCPEIVYKVLHTIEDNTNAAIGLSSMGPLLYAIVSDDEKSCSESLKQICTHYNAELLGISHGRNQGFDILEEKS